MPEVEHVKFLFPVCPNLDVLWALRRLCDLKRQSVLCAALSKGRTFYKPEEGFLVKNCLRRTAN
jgi:hypothetical protein